ncbi:diguanylate cyclase [Candidatus Saccharibacteria bacterium]|nr:diguanylate cyclase [Candidatus Saccharibacteria bacterium]
MISGSKPILFDPLKSYEDNYLTGPYDVGNINYVEPHGRPSYSFLGFPIYSPFGIAAGSLPTSRHTTAAFCLGFDVVVYKTQRSTEFPCNPFPNILPLQIEGDLTLDKLEKPIFVRDDYPTDLRQLSITNSFGVPSNGPSVWMNDFQQAQTGVHAGQLLIMSVVGTIQPGFTAEDYYADFARSAQDAKEAGAKVIEINLSCPNVASEGVICYSPDAVFEICKQTKAAIGDVPLVIKIGYFSHDQQALLERIVDSTSNFVSAISAINTLQGEILNKSGKQALPGKGRNRSGVCGASVKWAGIDMVRRLDTLRKAKNYDYEIIGVGGVMEPGDFIEYREAGADVVQSVTGAMWDPELAMKIKRRLDLIA